MTMRKSIGVLMELKFDSSSGNKRFCISDEKKLSDWMFENLIFLYCETDEPMAEAKLITQYNPPLNIKNNTNPVNAEFRKELSALRTNDNHTVFEVKKDSSPSIKYSKTRIALGIVVILIIIYNVSRLFGDYTINEDGKTQYIVTQDFLAATDYETAHNLNSLYFNNPNEPEITDSYADTHWDKFVNFYQGDVVVVLKFDGYGYKVKRLSDGMKGIIPKKFARFYVGAELVEEIPNFCPFSLNFW